MSLFKMFRSTTAIAALLLSLATFNVVSSQTVVSVNITSFLPVRMIKDPKSDNIMVVGTTIPGNTAMPDYDAFFGKMTTDGELLWKTVFGKKGDQIAEKVLYVPDSNEFLVVGETTDAFDEMTSWNIRSGSRIFIIKFDSQGEKKWSAGLEAPMNTRFLDAVYVPSDKTLLVAGLTGQGFEGIPFIWIVKSDDGSQKRRICDALPLALTYDSSKDLVFVAGVGFGPLRGSNSQYRRQGFFGTLSSSGEIGGEQFISTNFVPAAIVYDSNTDRVYLTGAYVEKPTQDTDVDIMIAAFDRKNANEIWNKRWGSSQGMESGYIIDFAQKTKSIVIAGTTTGSLESGMGNSGAEDAFVAVYDDGGNRKFVKMFGTTDIDIVSSFFINQDDGTIYVLVHQFVNLDNHKYGQLVNIKRYLDGVYNPPTTPAETKPPSKSPSEQTPQQDSKSTTPSNPPPTSGGSSVGTFFLTITILSILGVAGYFAYMKYWKPKQYVQLPLSSGPGDAYALSSDISSVSVQK